MKHNLNLHKKCLIVILILIVFGRCKKNDQQATDTEQSTYTVEEISALDNLKTATDVTKTTIVLQDGESLDAYLKRVEPTFYNTYLARISNVNRISDFNNLRPIEAVKRLQSLVQGACLYFSNKANFTYPKEADNKPAQTGLKWGHGLKNWKSREKPGDNCTYLIHGFDCSGFVSAAYSLAGVQLLAGSSQQANPTNLENALEVIPEFKDVKVIVVEGSPNPKEFKSGDIIYWYRNGGNTVNHDGIISLQNNGTVAIFQSSGNDNECEKNLSENRGVRIIATENANWFGAGKWGILKILPSLEGTWLLTDNTTPISLHYKFTKTGDGVYTANGSIEVPNADVATLTYDTKTGLTTFKRAQTGGSSMFCKGDFTTGETELLDLTINNVPGAGYYTYPVGTKVKLKLIQ